MARVNVEVGAVFSREGRITPVMLWWPDGRSFSIDRVLDVRRAASLKGGGIGLRYTCRIRGKERYLFYENPTWFVEVDDQEAAICADDSPS